MPAIRHPLTIVLVLHCFLAIQAYSEDPEPIQPQNKQGLHYTLRRSTEPIPNRIHILRVDLSQGMVQPRVVLGPDPDGDGPAEVSLTDPRKLASDPSVLAFVNSNPWDSFPDANGTKNRNWHRGQHVDIHGLAGTAGVLRSPMAPHPASVWFDQQSRVHFGHQEGDRPREATAGFEQIVSEGKIVTAPGGDRHPRTGMGTDQQGNMLWIVVVDGRQTGFSEGMRVYELAALMQDLGCWNATNMDGGGSSILGLVNEQGDLTIMNSPSDRILGRVKIRPLPMVLTIQSTRPSQ